MKTSLKAKMLVITNILGHPLTSRIHYLLRFLEEKKIDSRIFDISFYHEQQSIHHFLRSIQSFLSKSISFSGNIRLPAFPIIGHEYSNIRRFMHFFYSFLIFLLAKLIKGYLDHDVIVAADPFSAFIAASVKKTKTFIVYEDLDCFEDLYTGIRRIFISFFEKLALRRANLVISVSEPLLKRAQQLNPNCILIPNGANLQSFPQPNRTRRENFIVYAGSMDEWAGLRLVIKAFPSIKDKFPWIKMKIIGAGEEKNALEKLSKSLSIQNNVVFTGRLEYDQMAATLCHCYLGLAMFKPGKAAAYASPLKIFDYMAAGLPIIATDIGDIGRLVKESNSGIAVKWNSKAFIGAAEEILAKPKLWSKFHDNGLEYVKKYDWSNLFNNWIQQIETKISNSKIQD